MAVLIENMEMPTEGYIDVRIKCNGTASFAIAKYPYFKEVEAVPIPEPHGRTIDADALVEDLKRQCEEVFKIDAVSPDDFWITRDQAYNERLWKTWCESFFEYLKTRETIIP